MVSRASGLGMYSDAGAWFSRTIVCFRETCTHVLHPGRNVYGMAPRLTLLPPTVVSLRCRRCCSCLSSFEPVSHRSIVFSVLGAMFVER